MISVDTSSLVAFLAGETGSDVESLDQALELNQVVLPPVVLTEILSVRDLDENVARLVRRLPVLELQPGYWERAGLLRSRILARNLRARLADTLIAQSCLDHQSALITRDSDFRHFSTYADLRLV